MPSPASPPSAAPPSLWHVKPWWCQPWSILLTGCALPAGLWFLWPQPWLTGLVGLGVLGWWGLFLYWVPRQYAIAYRTRIESSEGCADTTD